MKELETRKHNHIVNNFNLFSQFTVSSKIKLSGNMPNIEQIVSCVVDPEVISMKTINTMKGLSFEGQYLTGKKVVLELKFKQKILYATDHYSQSVHVVEKEIYRSAYIVIPCKIEGTDPEYLIKYKYLKPNIKVEENICRQINKRTIFNNMSIMIILTLVPSYELCYSIQTNCNESMLYLMDQDANECTLLHTNLKKMSIRPRWSPNGEELAFLANDCGNWILYTYNIKSDLTKCITDPNYFKSITGFSWSADGHGLFFTSCDGEVKEIFFTDSTRIDYKQLTFGEKVYISYNPKCSPDGKMIGLIRSFNHIDDLWLMKLDGTNYSRITNDGFITTYDWSHDSNFIVFIGNGKSKRDKIGIYEIDQNKSFSINDCDHIYEKRKVRYSSVNLNFAFIGSECGSDNIYLYHNDNKELINITNYKYNSKIYDFTWNLDGTKIYYSLKDMFYYDIYVIDLVSNRITQLTCQNALKIDLDYRPRIV